MAITHLRGGKLDGDGARPGTRTRAGHWPGALVLACMLLGGYALGCGSAPPPPPKPERAPPPPAPPPEPIDIEPEEVDAGNECIKAIAECGGGVCAVKTTNSCKEPLTCDVAIAVTCRVATDVIKATARSRETVNGESETTITAEGDCIKGEVVYTEIDEMNCR